MATVDIHRKTRSADGLKTWLCVAVVCLSIILSRLHLLYDIRAGHNWSKTSCLIAFPLRIVESHQDYGNLGCNRSISGDSMRLGGKLYTSGITTHANARIQFEPVPAALGTGHLSGRVGLSDHVVYLGGSAVASILIDGVKQWGSQKLVSGIVESFRVSVAPGNKIELVINDAGDGIRSDEVAWIDLQIQ